VVEGFSPKNPDLPWRRPRCNISKNSFSSESPAHPLHLRTHRRSQQAFAKFRRRDCCFGIQASQGVKLSNIARSLQEEIPLLKTEDPSLAQSTSEELETASPARTAAPGQPPRDTNTVLCLDLSDVRKEYARKMEFLDQVWDGSAGEVHPATGCASVIGAEVHGGELTPLYQQLFSVRARIFVSENDELLSAIDQLRAPNPGPRHLGHGPWRRPAKALGAAAGAARTLCHPLHRTARGPRPAASSCDPASSGACCRLRYQAKIIKIENGQEKVYSLRYGAEPFRLPGREEQLLLVVVAGFGQEPLLLLTNLCGVRDSQSLWWIATNLPDAVEN